MKNQGEKNYFEAPLYRTPILLKGYHPQHNAAKDYKTAKQPCVTGFTLPDYEPPTAEEVESWTAAGGWVGHLVPENHHVIDAEDPHKIMMIRAANSLRGLKPPVNKTNNGLQFCYRTNGGPPFTGDSNRMTRLGFRVTDRAAGRNYVINPPNNGRTWENPDALFDPPVLPEELERSRNNLEDTINELAWSLGELHRAGDVAGFEDLDAGFMDLLVGCGLPEKKVMDAFRLLFLDKYSERRTFDMLVRTVERKKSGVPMQGAGTLIKRLKDIGQDKIVAVIVRLERLTGKSDEEDDEKPKKATKTDKLIRLGLSAFEFFHDKDLKAYGTIVRDKHHETYSLRSKSFRTCLSGLYWSEFGEGLGGQIVQDAIGTLEGHAIHGGPCQEVHVRLAEAAGALFLDLGNERHEVVEIRKDGWRVRDDQNIVKFRRPPGMAPLPYPREGGSIYILRKYVNLQNPDDWPVYVGFIIMCFHPTGPFPILSLTGEQGSAKSTSEKMIKFLTDPSTAPLRSLPKEIRDLAITSMHTRVLAYDNLSDIHKCMSDALCRQATGGGFATRTLFSDDEETIIDTRRPIMMNGISNVVQRHDLADRSIIINMAAIPEDRRISEADFWREFEDDAPEILGAILDAVSCAYKNYGYISLPRKPRMADFAVWVSAAEPALGWPPGTFLEAYELNRKEVNALTLDADLVGTAVKEMMEARKFVPWEGRATDLLKELENHVEEKTTKSKQWPKAGNALSGRLKRAVTTLRAEGIEVVFGGRSGGERKISIGKVGEKIVTIVTDREEETQGFDINRNSNMTMFDEGIVTGSS